MEKMKKNIIEIGKEYNYLNEVRRYKINGNIINDKFTLPNGIFNKQITGCGGTTLALEDGNNTIICSPRNELLINKYRQYDNTLLVVAGVNENDIKEYLSKYDIPKILVSYDSFYKLIDVIGNKDKWHIVIDEFQILLSDSSFKSETELKLLEQLKQFPYITYMSATPLLDEFINDIPIFNDVSYYECKWENSIKVGVVRHKCTNPIDAGIEIVKTYLSEDFPFITLKDGSIFYSKEAVIYLNSVNNICDIIKATKISPDKVNIIVGNGIENDEKISRIGKGYKRGNIPLKNEDNKLITFCSSTAFCGVDMWSNSAATFVISDCRRINTSVDISTELVQIAGRQRNDNNPFKYYIHYFFNTNRGIEQNENDFYDYIDAKIKTTRQEILADNMAESELKIKRIKDNKKMIRIFMYENSYTYYDEDKKQFVFNYMAYLNEKYNYIVQRENYINGMSVKNLINSTQILFTNGNQIFDTFKEHISNNTDKMNFEERMKRYCHYKNQGGITFDLLAMELERKYKDLRAYYELLGYNRIKALNYKECNLKNELKNKSSEDSVILELSKYNINGFYSSKDIKKFLSSIYDKLGLKMVAKATDIKKWYNCKDMTKWINGKGVKGINIISSNFKIK
jgi:hypothetical protein